MAGVYSVSQVNRYIQGIFTRDFLLANICVKGEISNCKYHSSGHIYFTLKDQDAALSCIMFATRREALGFRLRDGQQAEVSGHISLYEKSGTYQLYAENIRLSGTGELYERFLMLKAELEEMGMFDAIYKKPVPKYAMNIGVVTAETGAAIRDIINVASRRNPYAQLVLYPAKVQGEGAAQSIVRGIKCLDKMGLDVIIVARGGGSIEDLWAFNEEMTARAVFDAHTPVISGVGHETDFTITDFAADLRAPTPSAAAEIASFEYSEFVRQLDDMRLSLDRSMGLRLTLIKNRLSVLSAALEGFRPAHRIGDMKRKLSDMQKRLKAAEDGHLRSASMRLAACSGRLDALSPLKKISSGYGYVTDAGGNTIRSVKDVSMNMKLVTRIKDGRIISIVESCTDER